MSPIPQTYRNDDGHTVHTALAGYETVDATNDVRCRTCGETVTLTTDGIHGQLVGIESDGRRHPCRTV